MTLSATTLAALSGASYYLGRAVEEDASELRFLNRWRTPTVDEACLTFVGEYAARSPEANDVIFVGDSGCRSDLDPLLFESLTGLRAYNLGTFGTDGPVVLAVSAKAYLSNHPRPRAVVLCLLPFSLRYDAKLQVGTVPWRFAEAYGAQEDKPAAAQLGSGFAAIAYILRRGASRGGVELRTLGNQRQPDVLNLPLTGMPSETYTSLSARVRTQRGRWVLRGENQPPAPPSPKQAAFVSPDWDPHLDKIAQLCEAAGIPLLFRVAPMRADLARTIDFLQAKRCIEAVHSRNPTVILKRPIFSYCDRALCWDSMHLNDKGAHEFTAIVARDVEDALRTR